MFVSREGGSKDNNKLIYDVEKKMIGSNLYVQEFSPDLTLGEVRGKILIINRDDLMACGDQVIGAFAYSYPDAGMTNLSVGGMPASGGTDVCRFYVQDMSDYEKDSEWWECNGKYFEKIADEYFREKDYIPNHPCLTEKGAWRGLGIVMMDYAGESKYGSHDVYGDVLVKALIDINFAD